MTMASMQTISKLHQQAPERAPVKNGQFGRFAARGAYAFGTRRAHLGAAAASALPLSEEIEERFAPL